LNPGSKGIRSPRTGKPFMHFIHPKESQRALTRTTLYKTKTITKQRGTGNKDIKSQNKNNLQKTRRQTKAVLFGFRFFLYIENRIWMNQLRIIIHSEGLQCHSTQALNETRTI